jgi:hypothetical protein
MPDFIDNTPTLDTYWRAIVLLGKNTASYKFALAKSILEINNNNSVIMLDEIALPFAHNVSRHLREHSKQITGRTGPFLDSCKKFNDNQIDENTLKEETLRHGFKYVLDAFHNLGDDSTPKFFKKDYTKNKSIILTDNFYNLLSTDQMYNFINEIEARWKLWETAISLNINSKLIEIEIDENFNELFTIDRNLKRIDVTSCKDALIGYQKGKCFYCGCSITIESEKINSCEVDHYFPHKLKRHGLKNCNQVWNLVLSCESCNRGTNGKFAEIPEIKFLEKLDKRNNYYIESHHPLRETILYQTGLRISERHDFLQKTHAFAREFITTRLWKPIENYD